jgi:hypothetical protein
VSRQVSQEAYLFFEHHELYKSEPVTIEVDLSVAFTDFLHQCQWPRIVNSRQIFDVKALELFDQLLTGKPAVQQEKVTRGKVA